MRYQLCNGLLRLMAVLIDTGDNLEKLQLLETFKNKLRHARRHRYHIEQV